MWCASLHMCLRRWWGWHHLARGVHLAPHLFRGWDRNWRHCWAQIRPPLGWCPLWGHRSLPRSARLLPFRRSFARHFASDLDEPLAVLDRCCHYCRQQRRLAVPLLGLDLPLDARCEVAHRARTLSYHSRWLLWGHLWIRLRCNLLLDRRHVLLIQRERNARTWTGLVLAIALEQQWQRIYVLRPSGHDQVKQLRCE